MRIAASKCRILLVGLMGAGKTAVGEAIATRTGWPHLDNDVLVNEAAGATKSSLLQSQGESALRVYERLALEEVLEAEAPLVASIAGGVLLAEDAVEALEAGRRKDAFVVWLRVPHAVIAERITAHPQDRPWISKSDPLGSVVALAATREPVFQSVADLVVDAYGVEAETVAAEILAAAATASAQVAN